MLRMLHAGILITKGVLSVGCNRVVITFNYTMHRSYFYKIIPEQTAGVIERFGKFRKLLAPGINFKIPFVDTISYMHNMKETAYLCEL